MSEAKFTKGPWVAVKSPFEVYNVDHGVLKYEVCGDNNLIAAIYDEDSADMHLIAAAPDLYAALEHFFNNLSSYDIDIIIEALAKARGEK